LNVCSDSPVKKLISKAKDHLAFIETMGCIENELEFDEGVISS
jgi:hypothetical protein